MLSKILFLFNLPNLQENVKDTIHCNCQAITQLAFGGSRWCCLEKKNFNLIFMFFRDIPEILFCVILLSWECSVYRKGNLRISDCKNESWLEEI